MVGNFVTLFPAEDYLLMFGAKPVQPVVELSIKMKRQFEIAVSKKAGVAFVYTYVSTPEVK